LNKRSKGSQQFLNTVVSTEVKRFYDFDEFRIDVEDHVLLRNGEMVPLKPKAFDLLVLLVRNRGRVMEKEELMRAEWPGSFVEESNLTQTIYMLRKTLGESKRGHSYIMNIPKRGYRFTAKVKDSTSELAEWAARDRDFETRSVAVLPFKPLREDSRDEYLELGIADALITALSNLNRIIVRPTSAVRKYGALEQDAVEAGRELKVEVVLDGTIQKTGDRIRATVRLLRVSDGKPLWAGKFDEPFTSIFTVQDSISEKLTKVLALKLVSQEKDRLTKRYTDNSEAYSLYLKGRYNWNKATEEGLWKAIDFFNRAIAADPRYALAYVGVADAYTSLDWYGVLSTGQSNPHAKAAAQKALEIDDALAEAHASLAMAKQYEWDWSGAEKEYERAIELSPSYAAAYQWYGIYLTLMGRFDEALAHMDRAQELDPISLSISGQKALVLQCARRYDEAIDQCLKTLEVEPGQVEARFCLAMTYALKGLLEEAIAEYQKLPGNNPDFKAMLGHAYAVSGRRAEARAILDELKKLSKLRYIPPFWVAMVHIGLGDKSEALSWLEKACEDPDDSLAAVKVFPFCDPLRSDVRFTEVLRRMGLAI
jgi:DNA-binding winged helix-turn-helix (wHTH) protein/tetratricopeptide (TPR) repeat protein